jgi:prefoldin subunit 5
MEEPKPSEWPDGSKKILVGLDELNGEATTTELKEYTGIDADQIHYRRKKYLEPAGMMESEQQPGKPGQLQPMILSLTSKGEQLVEYLHEEIETAQTLETQMSNLRGRVSELEKEISSIKGTDDSRSMYEIYEDVNKRADKMLAEYDEFQEQQSALWKHLNNLKYQMEKIRKRLDDLEEDRDQGKVGRRRHRRKRRTSNEREQ